MREQNQRTSEETELSDGNEVGANADEEGQEVGEGGDGNADTRLGESEPHPLGHVHVVLDALTPGGHEQEHVVHPDA